MSAKTAAFIHCFVTTQVSLLWPGRLSALDVKQSIEHTRSQFSGWLLTPCLHLWACVHMVHSSIYTRANSSPLYLASWRRTPEISFTWSNSRLSTVEFLKGTSQGGREVLLHGKYAMHQAVTPRSSKAVPLGTM